MRGRGATVRALSDGIDPRSVNVADCGDLTIAHFVSGVEQIIHAAAGANHSQAQHIVGAKDSSGRQGRESAGYQKTSAIRSVLHGAYLRQ
jgi:hypothetical protein